MASDKLEMRAYKLEHDAAWLERLPAGERSDFTASVARAFRATSRDIRDGAAEIARLTRELEEARERGRAREQAAQTLCEIYFEIAADAIGEDEVRQLRDERIDALATPPAEGDGEADVTTPATHQDSLQVDDGD